MFFATIENRCIELHSPDGIHSCILRAVDPQEALAWFNALHSAIARSAQRALLDANRALSNIIGELKHIGWLSRRVGNEQVIYFTESPKKKRPNKRHHLNTERIARNSWGKTSNRQRDREWKNVAVNRISSIFVWIDRVVGSHFRLALALF